MDSFTSRSRGGSAHPRLFTSSTAQSYFWLEYNMNNGHGMGGLCSVAATSPYGRPMNYNGQHGNYSALEDDPNGWHHYAVVWNDEGIKNITTENGGPAIFATLLDGKVYASHNLEGRSKSLQRIVAGPSRFDICDPSGGDISGIPFSIDELKIWNYDKTEFEVK